MSVAPLPWWAATRRRAVLKHWAQHPLYGCALAAVLERARSLRSDAVVTNTSVLPFGALAAAAVQIPHVWAIHELREHYRFSFGSFSVRYAMGNSRHVIFNSYTTRRSWQRDVGNAPNSVLYQPVSPGAFRWSPGEQQLRLLTLTAIDPVKRVDVSIESLAVATLLGADATLRIVGPSSAEYVRRLRRLAQERGVLDRVQFAPAVNDVSAEMARADLLLHPSPQESYGRVLVEAMMVGLPVLAKDAGASREVLGSAGALFSDPIDAGQEIARSTPALRAEQSLRGMRRARDVVDTERFFQGLATAFS